MRRNSDLPHRDTDPPFRIEDIILEPNKAKRAWMLQQNEEWEEQMYEESRERWKRERGY